MHNKHQKYILKISMIFIVIFIIIASVGLFAASEYISSRLLISNQNYAKDIALLVTNNFSITDSECEYLKGLTFNEMEVDPINLRLMNVGNGVKLNSKITNVYLVCELKDSEIKYSIDNQEDAEFFGYDIGTKMNGIWLLNGTIDDDGKFVVKQREDICRYTLLTANLQYAIENETSLGEFSSDAWGSFISGYAPLYSVEGNYIGVVGIDMEPDEYQNSAKIMILVLLSAFVFTVIVMGVMFVIFYIKYSKTKENELYFDFYSRMSHDLRTPMNGILGMAVLSKDETNVDVLHHNFKMVEEAGNYMQKLINDTLDLQKIDAGKLVLDKKPCNLKIMTDELDALIKTGVNKKNIHFNIVSTDVDLDCYCNVDSIRLKQVFVNLLSNAVKFTPDGGAIFFRISDNGSDSNTKHLIFEIQDSGIGMSQNFINNHLFKPFEQEKNELTKNYVGTGLGLSIVKRLIEMMGGSISVKSIVGEGTIFTVELDFDIIQKECVDKLKAENDSSIKNNLERLKNKKILVCEDHPLNQEIIRRILSKAGCICVVANNGQEGLDTFSTSKINEFDAILMDIRMPIMDGIETAKNIRALQREDAMSVPIIAMTANAYDEDIKKSINAGMNEHLAKPIDVQLLLTTLNKFINKQ